MKRLIATLAVTAAGLVIAATAWTAVVQYGGQAGWSAGMGFGSAFSSSWWKNSMAKNAYFDSTITFVDNVSYGWHNTRRGTDPYLQIHWLSSQVKKGHCRSNVNTSAWAGCTVYS